MERKQIPDRLYPLRFIQRYALTPRITSETVAEHSFFVAAFVFELHTKYKFDLHKAVTMAIIHDFAECEIGDVTLTAKLKHPDLIDAIHKAEDRVMETFGRYIHNLFKEYEARESWEAKIVKYADVLQVKQYLSIEQSIGNPQYLNNMLQATKDSLAYFEEMLKPIRRTEAQ